MQGMKKVFIGRASHRGMSKQALLALNWPGENKVWSCGESLMVQNFWEKDEQGLDSERSYVIPKTLGFKGLLEGVFSSFVKYFVKKKDHQICVLEMSLCGSMENGLMEAGEIKSGRYIIENPCRIQDEK